MTIATLEVSFTSRWRVAIAVAAVPSFYTGLSVWAFEAGVLPVPPLIWLAVLIAIAAPVLLQQASIARTFRSPLAGWLAIYLLVTALWFMASDGNDASVVRMRSRLFSMCFFLVVILLYGDERTHRPARLALAWSVVFGVLVNLYDLTHPGTFSQDWGRAAGLYLNANGAGLALVMGMTVALDEVSQRWRGPFVALASAGVLVTQSRSSALCLVVAVLVLAFSGEVRLRTIAGWFGAFLAMGLVVLWASGAIDVLLRSLSLAQLAQMTRLTSASGSGAEGDYLSTQTRLQAAREAWDLFTENPILGAGLGSSGFKAHNSYVMLAAEHGLLGLLLYPGFILALLVSGVREQWQASVVLALVLAISGAFSHNVLDDLPTLLCVALTGGLAFSSRLSLATSPQRSRGSPGWQPATSASSAQ